MKRDWIILTLFLIFVITAFLITLYYANYKVDTTVWINKEEGDGPWKLQSGNRDLEEAMKKAMKEAYQDDEIIIKETPSAHEVIFSTAKGILKDETFHQSDRVPEVKY